MTKRMPLVIFLCLLLTNQSFLTNLSAQTRPTPVADDYNAIFKALKWRSIGPFRGGRSVCATGGGLWKTDDMGISWRNVSDGFFKTGSVGAVAVAESDPNVVYVGMGEHAVRGVMTHPGDGV